MRINITVDRDTIRKADRLARRRKTSRSAVMREGVEVLDSLEAQEVEVNARRQRQRRAADAMDRLARDFGDWPADAILRAARDRWSRGVRS